MRVQALLSRGMQLGFGMLVLSAVLGLAPAPPATCLGKVRKTVVNGVISWELICSGTCDAVGATCGSYGTGILTWCQCSSGPGGAPNCLTVLVQSEESTGVRCVRNGCTSECTAQQSVPPQNPNATDFTCTCMGG